MSCEVSYTLEKYVVLVDLNLLFFLQVERFLLIFFKLLSVSLRVTVDNITYPPTISHIFFNNYVGLKAFGIQPTDSAKGLP